MKQHKASTAHEHAVTIGLDAMRICMGMKPSNFTADEVVRWLSALASTPAPKIAPMVSVKAGGVDETH